MLVKGVTCCNLCGAPIPKGDVAFVRVVSQEGNVTKVKFEEVQCVYEYKGRSSVVCKRCAKLIYLTISGWV